MSTRRSGGDTGQKGGVPVLLPPVAAISMQHRHHRDKGASMVSHDGGNGFQGTARTVVARLSRPRQGRRQGSTPRQGGHHR